MLHFHKCQTYLGDRRCDERGYPVVLYVPPNDTMLMVWMCQECAEHIHTVRKTVGVHCPECHGAAYEHPYGRICSSYDPKGDT